MCSLAITDAAYSRIQRELVASPIESPIVSLVHTARPTLSPDMERRVIDPRAADSELRDVVLERDRANSSANRWYLIPGVYSRDDFPPESRVEIRGIWFSFSPEWQQVMKGWLLDALGDNLVLKDAGGRVVLPHNPEAAGGA
jgi:hypothetical protein